MRELIPPHKRTVELTFEIFNGNSRSGFCLKNEGRCDTIHKVVLCNHNDKRKGILFSCRISPGKNYLTYEF